VFAWAPAAADATTPGQAMVRVADRLEDKQIKVGVSAGIWPQEALYTGAIAAGMVDAYIWTGDAGYLASAELAGGYILTAPQWNFLGDEALALMQLSRTAADPQDNIWRTALETCYRFISQDVGGTARYLAGYGGTEPSTAVFYIAHHVVAAYYVNAADKTMWRQGLLDWLAKVDDASSNYPVMAMGVATWALASTGPLDNTLIDPSGVGAAYWNLKRLSDLPALLVGHQIPVGQPQAGAFYWRFDHTNSAGQSPFAGGYSEDAIYAAKGLAAAARRHPGLNLGGALSRARTALINGVAASGAVLEHLSIWGYSYHAFAGEMLQALAMLGGPGDLNLDNFVDFFDVAVLADCMRDPACVSCPPCMVADIDGDGDVDFGDLRLLTAWWLEEFGG